MQAEVVTIKSEVEAGEYEYYPYTVDEYMGEDQAFDIDEESKAASH